MSKRQIRRIITTIFIILLLIVTIERIYNSRDEFQVTAEDASYYGIVEAKVETKLKIRDFEILYNVLEENYPFFKVNERLHGIDWLGNKKKYKRLIRNTKNDAEFFVAMERILGDLNNRHVNILSGDDFKRTYKSYYESYALQDNLNDLHKYEALTNPFVMYRYKMDESIETSELYNEPNLETKVLKKDEIAYIKIKSMPFYDKETEDYLEIKRFLKDVEDYGKLIIDIRGNHGENSNYWENIVELLINEPLSARYYSFFKDGHRHSTDAFKVEDLTTIKLLDEEILSQFPEEVRRDFDFYKDYSICINTLDDDLNNSEGIYFNGKVYLLVDENVFSAAENFASFAKDTGFATLVGGPTGGGRVFAEIPITHLLQTKFAVRYSREMGINADGTINMETKTVPHIEVDEIPNEDFNKDECIQAVIRD